MKLKLYFWRDEQEYWVINWQERRLEIYRRENAVLKLYNTLNESDILTTPLLPEFSCRVGQLFTTKRI